MLCFNQFSFTSSDYLQLNTPVVIPSSAMDRYSSKATLNKLVIDDIDDAIAVATGNIGMMPGVAFQARVSQLAQLNTAHRTVSWEGFWKSCYFLV